MKILIADDEYLARRLIREYLRSHGDLQIAGESETGLDTVMQIEALQPDLIFLDIQMPEMTGLDILEVTGRRHGVIFTTAYDQYAVKAFDLYAVDYLLKPFSQQRFDEAVLKAKKTIGNKTTDSNSVDEAASNTPGSLHQVLAAATETSQRLLIRDRGTVHALPLSDIDYIEAQDDYIVIHSGEKSWMKTQSLSDIEKQLNPAKFVRVHRSYLLALHALTGFERSSKDSQSACLKSGAKIPVSRSGYERVRSLLV
ncbi:response regulator transcription factor [Undibacterium oligocarboniphilum]|uniref:Response regulator transcription factor n=1 Tax=Undibacterium oligocarboniphilum TaxID=666702 RepID=A0A850QCW9_9BURK|nr:response regulator transcription factor [Undibacterium oligocarboniphilum]NVO77099.1 response regulator transcription factor [Undibacterium oligocarboniphilum]